MEWKNLLLINGILSVGIVSVGILADRIGIFDLGLGIIILFNSYFLSKNRIDKRNVLMSSLALLMFLAIKIIAIYVTGNPNDVIGKRKVLLGLIMVGTLELIIGLILSVIGIWLCRLIFNPNPSNDALNRKIEELGSEE